MLIKIKLENPFKTWWKARKYFKRPKVYFNIYCQKTFSVAKILDFQCWDVWWKDKYNSPRHEFNPFISIVLFSYINITIKFGMEYYDEFGEKQNGDSYYWEYLLDWLHYRKNLTCYPTWTGRSKLYKSTIFGIEEDGSDDKYNPIPYVVPCVAMSLNKKGIKQLKKELKNE